MWVAVEKVQQAKCGYTSIAHNKKRVEKGNPEALKELSDNAFL